MAVTILALADEIDPRLGYERIKQLSPDVVVSCGDLSFGYLEFVVTAANKPLLYVPGDEDPDLERAREETAGRGVASSPLAGGATFDYESAWSPGPGPAGCTLVDRTVETVAGLRIGGLGGTRGGADGPNRYSDFEMRWRALRLEGRARLGISRRGLDVLVVHTPSGDTSGPEHPPVDRLLRVFGPRLLIHGGPKPPPGVPREREEDGTRIVNATPSAVVEIDP